MLPPIPRPPSPSADPRMTMGTEEQAGEAVALPEADSLDIFTLKPLAALKMLCGSIETLIRVTSDAPPTPPSSQPRTPVIGAGPENVPNCAQEGATKDSFMDRDDDDGVPPKAKTPIGSPEAHPAEPLHIVGANIKPLNIQHSAVVRKFYSKKPPPIGLEEYLLRLHQFCPMSTGVYLATSLYIHRLVVIEKIIPVTIRNVHRLVLAGLRVAMKALEDQSYPHRRFAKVGGVSESELGRLEISFCFVTDFELRMSGEKLLEHAKTIRAEESLGTHDLLLQPQHPMKIERSVVAIGRTKTPAMVTQEASIAA